MDTLTCRVQFVGGPSDGLVVEADHSFLQRRKLLMPARPAAQDATCAVSGQPDRYATVYLMAGKRRVPQDGTPMVVIQYRFLGFEAAADRAARGPTMRRRVPRRLDSVGALVSRARRRFVRWMLAKVDHPLKVGSE